MDIEYLKQWIGRSETARDIITPGLVERFRATLAGKVALTPEAIPLCLHWCLAPAAVPEDETGPDGHPVRGGFLPPVPLERRMWGGGEIEFLAPFKMGDAVERRSAIQDIDHKKGRSGELVVVAVGHVYETARGVAVRERQDIIYRNPDPAGQGGSKPAQVSGGRMAARSREIEATTLFMFRYSALTFNGHRIHYDPVHATQVEGYPALVFHGPLQATLLANFAAETAGSAPAHFTYRGVAPLFGGGCFSINAGAVGVPDASLALWCANAQGKHTMEAEARWG